MNFCTLFTSKDYEEAKLNFETISLTGFQTPESLQLSRESKIIIAV